MDSSHSIQYSNHAHPNQSMTEFKGLQSVENAFASLDIDLQLGGLLGVDKEKVTDVYCPEVRRSQIAVETNIKHLDVVYCWKGLSFKQATEIAYWEVLFKSCLEKMVLDIIIRTFTEYLREENGMSPISSFPSALINMASESIDDGPIVPILAKFLSMKNPRLIDITIPDLVSDMISKFYQDGLTQTHTWFLSSRDLSSMVFNFVRTRDCFIDSFPFPSLATSFRLEAYGSDLTIIGNVEWQLPFIDFWNVPSALPVGAELRIAPKYIEPVLSDAFIRYSGNPEFVVSSNQLPLAWDSSKRCFRAIVSENRSRDPAHQHRRDLLNRLGGQRPPNSLETTLMARIVTRFPGDVRFETTTRYQLLLEVLPKPAPPSPMPEASLKEAGMNYVPVPSSRSNSDSTVSIHLSARSEESPGSDGMKRCPYSPPVVGSWAPANTSGSMSGFHPESGSPNKQPAAIHIDLQVPPVTPATAVSPCTSSVKRAIEVETQAPPASPIPWRNTWDEVVASPVESHKQRIPLGQIDGSTSGPESAHRSEKKSSDGSTNKQTSTPRQKNNDVEDRRHVRSQSVERSPNSLRESTNCSHNPEKRTPVKRVLGKKSRAKRTSERRADSKTSRFTELCHAIIRDNLHKRTGAKVSRRENELVWSYVPRKRKAVQQGSSSDPEDFSYTFKSPRISFDQLQHQGSSSGARRQRPSEDDGDVVSALEDVFMAENDEVYNDELMDCLAQVMKAELGKAGIHDTPRVRKWYGKMKEAQGDHIYAPCDKKRGEPLTICTSLQKSDSVLSTPPPAYHGKSAIRRGMPTSDPSPSTAVTDASFYISPTETVPSSKSLSDSHPNSDSKEDAKEATTPLEEVMRKIRENYDFFLKEKMEREKRKSESVHAGTVQDEDERAMAKVFLQGSDSSGYQSESEAEWASQSSLSDVMGMSRVSLDSARAE